MFVQNYFEAIPFFKISWSLCIEEHFYLAMPFIALAVTRWFREGHLFLLIVAAAPLTFRFIEHASSGLSFGYYRTATHLHFEGLLLGVWAAFLHNRRPQGWMVLWRAAKVMLPVAACLVWTISAQRLNSIFIDSLIALACMSALVLVVDAPALPFARTQSVYWIAVTSYSVYLSHAFTLDVAFRIVDRYASMPGILSLFIIAICLGGVGFIFYKVVEIPSLRMRDHLVTNRS